jgi:sialidase-1
MAHSLSLLLLLTSPAMLNAQTTKPVPPRIDVFVSGQEGYHTFRIPSLILTPRGSLLAFAEGRAAARDSGHIDLVMKRSADGGKSWGPLSVILSDPPNTVGNPCAVLDRQTGTIFLLHNRNLGSDTESAILNGTSHAGRTIWITSTSDDGTTWTSPRDITADVKEKNWTWYATGPGVGIQLGSGRLLIPSNHALAGSKTYQSHSIFSDDHGKTWHLGGISGVLGNESQAVELSDNSVMANMRSYRGTHCRGISISKDRGQTWTEMRDEPALVDPLCQGSITRFQRGGKTQLLFCNPADPKSRRNLTLRTSDDDGKTWPRSTVIEPGAAAYNCLAAFDDGTVGCLFERENYKQISFTRIAIP